MEAVAPTKHIESYPDMFFVKSRPCIKVRWYFSYDTFVFFVIRAVRCFPQT